MYEHANNDTDLELDSLKVTLRETCPICGSKLVLIELQEKVLVGCERCRIFHVRTLDELRRLNLSPDAKLLKYLIAYAQMTLMRKTRRKTQLDV